MISAFPFLTCGLHKRTNGLRYAGIDFRSPPLQLRRPGHIRRFKGKRLFQQQGSLHVFRQKLRIILDHLGAIITTGKGTGALGKVHKTGPLRCIFFLVHAVKHSGLRETHQRIGKMCGFPILHLHQLLLRKKQIHERHLGNVRFQLFIPLFKRHGPISIRNRHLVFSQNAHHIPRRHKNIRRIAAKLPEVLRKMIRLVVHSCHENLGIPNVPMRAFQLCRQAQKSVEAFLILSLPPLNNRKHALLHLSVIPQALHGPHKHRLRRQYRHGLHQRWKKIVRYVDDRLFPLQFLKPVAQNRSVSLHQSASHLHGKRTLDRNRIKCRLHQKRSLLNLQLGAVLLKELLLPVILLDTFLRFLPLALPVIGLRFQERNVCMTEFTGTHIFSHLTTDVLCHLVLFQVHGTLHCPCVKCSYIPAVPLIIAVYSKFQ